MRSLLTSVQSIRVLVEKSEVYTLEGVLELFLPLLDIIAGHYECSVEQILVDALSSHVLREQSEIQADFDQGIRKDLEMRAEPHCSAGGMIDTLPTAVISHALSFLTLKDRLPVELTCRSLLTLSRNTPVICAKFDADDQDDAHKAFTHELKPLELETTVELESTDMGGICTDLVKKLSMDVSEDSEWYPSHDYPSLTTLELECALEDAAQDSWKLWELVDKYQVSRIGFNFNDDQDLLDPPDFIHQITNRQFITALSFTDANSAISFNNYSHSLDLSQLKVLHVNGGELSFDALKVLVQPTLKELVLNFDDLGNNYTDMDMEDWSFLDLPLAEKMSIEFGSFVKIENVLSIFDAKGQGWASLKHLSIEIQNCEASAFLSLLQRCSIVRSLNCLIIVVDQLEGETCTIPINNDLNNVIHGLNHLSELKVGFHDCYDEKAHPSLLSLAAQAKELSESENANMAITFGIDSEIKESLFDDCMNTPEMTALSDWIIDSYCVVSENNTL